MAFAKECGLPEEGMSFQEEGKRGEPPSRPPLAISEGNRRKEAKKPEKRSLFVSKFDLRLTAGKASGGLYFSIPKKIIPLAPERNRLKRYAREEWRRGPFQGKSLFVRLISKGKIRKIRREEFDRAYQRALSKALGNRR